MSGDGGGAPPPSSNGGEFLLNLLRNPPQQSRQRPPSQTLPNDPAVAAVGSSHSFPPPLYQIDGQDHHHQLPNHPTPWSHSSPLFAPHNFFRQNPKASPILASASPPRPGLDQTRQQSHQVNHGNLIGEDDIRKMGSLGINPKLNSAHQQVPNDLMFGSLPFDFRNNASVSNSNGNQLRPPNVREVGLGHKVKDGMEIEYQKSLEFNQNKGPNRNAFEGNDGNIRGVASHVRRPPPGFSSNPRSVGNRRGNFEQNVSKGKSKFGEVNHRSYEREKGMGRGMSGERRLGAQLDSPGLPAGSNLHSVTASDIEESLLELHDEVRGDPMRRDSSQAQTELEELDEQIGTLVVEEGSSKKRDKRKDQNALDKVNGSVHSILAY